MHFANFGTIIYQIYNTIYRHIDIYDVLRCQVDFIKGLPFTNHKELASCASNTALGFYKSSLFSMRATVCNVCAWKYASRGMSFDARSSLTASKQCLCRRLHNAPQTLIQISILHDNATCLILALIFAPVNCIHVQCYFNT
jgi:hypothetical protein